MAAAMPEAVVSHWSTLIEGFQASPLSFYQAVEEALLRRQVPDTTSSRIDYREAGLVSANREYLRVTREKLVFDICGAPFGTGFFVSWWLAQDRVQLNPLLKALVVFGMLVVAVWILVSAGLFWGIIAIAVIVPAALWMAQMLVANGDITDDIIVVLPVLGPLYLWLFKPATYYRIDTMLMFQRAVHNAVLEVIDTMTAENGIRALADSERTPIMREFYQGKVA